MRTTAVKAAALVGTSAIFVVLALGLAFNIDLGQAAGQVLPVALAAALMTGFMVELDRRAVR